MKSVLYTLIALFAVNTTFGLEAHRSLYINVNPSDKDYSHLKLEHQHTYSNEQGDVVIFTGHYKPFLDKTHQFDSGFGYRKFYGNYGIGANLSYTTNNNPGFFSHRFAPGLEFFLGRFQISINQYYPLKRDLELGKFNYQFPVVSEFGLTYRPSKKYEFGIIPNFNHTTRKWGVDGRISAFVSNSIELGISPFYRAGSKGISFSIGYTFGGPKDRKCQSIRKSSQFLYQGNRIQIKEMPVSLPISEGIPVIPQTEGTHNPAEVIPVTPPNDKNWLDFFFSRH